MFALNKSRFRARHHPLPGAVRAPPTRPGKAVSNQVWDRLATGNPRAEAVRYANRVIQTKLEVGSADDQYEREADHVADMVMRMPDPASADAVSPGGRLMGPHHVQRQCTECEDELDSGPTDDLIQPKAKPGAEQGPVKRGGGAAPSPAPSATHAGIHAMRGQGRPLPFAARQTFEPRFGQDFSGVRVHADSQAAGLAKSLSARAFTVGNDIAFANGQYRPGTQSGDRLLAHELTHVVQQGQGESRRGQSVPAGLSAEPGKIQRQSGPGEDENVKFRRAGKHSAYFALGSATQLNEELINESDFKRKVSRFFRFYTDVFRRSRLIVEGFVSSEPRELHDRSLDTERARTLKKEFIDSGFGRDDVSEHGRGIMQDDPDEQALNRRADFYFEDPIEELAFQDETKISVEEPELLPNVSIAGCSEDDTWYIEEAVNEARWMIDHAIGDCRLAGEPTEKNLRNDMFRTAIPKRVKDGLAEFFNASAYGLPLVLAGLESIAGSLRSRGEGDERLGSLRFECVDAESCRMDGFKAKAFVRKDQDRIIRICPGFVSWRHDEFADVIKEAGETIIHELAHLEVNAADIAYYGALPKLSGFEVGSNLDEDEKDAVRRAYWGSLSYFKLLTNADSYSEFVLYLDRARKGETQK